MAVPKVTIELTVAEHQAVMNLLNVANAFKSVDTAAKAMGAGGAAAGDKLDKGFNAVNSTIQRATKAFLSLHTGMVVFHELISTVKAEIDAWEKRGREAQPHTLTLSTSIQRAQMQLGTGRVDSQGKAFTSDDMVALVSKLKTEIPGLDEIGLYAGAAKVYSTGTQLPADIMTELPARVMEAMPEYVLPEMRQEFAQVVGGVAQVMKAYYAGGNKINMQQAIAAYQQFQKISASESPEQFGGAPASGIAAGVLMTSGREKPEHMAAMIGTYQAIGIDPSGRRSVTNPLENYMQVREMTVKQFPEMFGMTMDEMVERMANIDKDKEPGLYKRKMRFLGAMAEGGTLEDFRKMGVADTGVVGNARMKGITVGLFQKDSVAYKMYQDLKREVQGAVTQEAVDREYAALSKQRSRPYMKPLLLEGAAVAAEQSTYAASVDEAMKTRVQDIYSKAIQHAADSLNVPFPVKQAGIETWWQSRVATSGMSAGETAATYANRLEETMSTLRQLQAGTGEIPMFADMTPAGRVARDEDIKQLTEAIRELRRFVEIASNNAEATRLRPLPVEITNPQPPQPPPTNPLDVD